MKTIPISNGMEALVDDEDYNRVIGLVWHIHVKKKGQYLYARTRVKIDGKWEWVMMHRLIIDAPDNVLVDHEDGKGLNNQRYNLRQCSYSENGCNRHRTHGSSEFKGVSWNSQLCKWKVTIQKDGMSHHGGYFFDEAEAAWAYDELALKLHGQFACLNLGLVRSLKRAPWYHGEAA
jgi:hypothetical protein